MEFYYFYPLNKLFFLILHLTVIFWGELSYGKLFKILGLNINKSNACYNSIKI